MADTELLRAFADESEEILNRMEAELGALARTPQDPEAINAVFRSLHTIKGNSSFLDLQAITKLSHVAETALDQARSGKRKVTPGLLGIAAAVLAELREMIVGQQPGKDVKALVEAIERFNAGDEKAASAFGNADVPAASVQRTGMVRIDEGKVARMVNDVNELELVRYALERLPERFEGLGDAAAELRFELDMLVTKLNRISKSLGSTMFGVRLVPVNTVFQRFPKVVEDLARKLGKRIQLRIVKGEAELDKHIVDAIADPMTHLIRNSCDHGIETNEDRRKAGKPPAGTIILNSFVKGNYVYIEIADDGRGIDGDKILQSAIRKGIVPAGKAATMTKEEKIALIFAPGFSTAEQVSDISGRGVGMDVVKSNISRLKGTVVVESFVGKGTVIQLRFPMSLAVMYLLLVRVGEAPCALPVEGVAESVDYTGRELLTAPPEGANPAEYLALYSVRSLLWGDAQGEVARDLFHVLRFNGKGLKNVGFVVEDFVSIEDAVVQSVDSYIASLPGVAGGTVRKD
ncbi:MAG: Hpt domain-containing protein, partial [Bdellovibrionales bacterium]|nr:Hpt domain-containing protein [Bdellovibrionales bacterium]